MASESLTRSPSAVAVVGPTAAGKTRLALELARRLGGEIISADMGQMYRRFDAGTAKPEGAWRDGVFVSGGIPYHLVDFLEPERSFSAADYARTARPILKKLERGGKPAIIAGGAGLYLRALLEGLDDLPRSDPGVRAELRDRLKAEGHAALHAELSRLDPAAASAIPAGNTQRLLRALEVYRTTGSPISGFWSGRKDSSRAPVLYLGLRRSPEELKRRIDSRAEIMFPAMLEEVRLLLKDGLTGEEPAFRCIGYREALGTARGALKSAEGLRRMQAATRAYAKRQGTWFRNQIPAVWLDVDGESYDKAADAAVREIRRWKR